MKKTALGALLLLAGTMSAHATSPPLAPRGHVEVTPVEYRTECDRYGDRCKRVWIEHGRQHHDGFARRQAEEAAERAHLARIQAEARAAAAREAALRQAAAARRAAELRAYQRPRGPERENYIRD